MQERVRRATVRARSAYANADGPGGAAPDRQEPVKGGQPRQDRRRVREERAALRADLLPVLAEKYV